MARTAPAPRNAKFFLMAGISCLSFAGSGLSKLTATRKPEPSGISTT